MPDPAASLPERLAQLKFALDTQGTLVESIVEEAVEALFAGDESGASRVIDADERVDAEDVRIEREAVSLLQDAATGPPAAISEADVRLVLTIVKVNNELERIADLSSLAAGHAAAFGAMPAGPLGEVPRPFRVLANSVIGIVQQTVRAFAEMSEPGATIVLRSDETTDAFKRTLLRDTEQRLASGGCTVDDAFALHATAAAFARAADHCTNIAEQIIYTTSGRIVRHENDHWSDPAPPHAGA